MMMGSFPLSETIPSAKGKPAEVLAVHLSVSLAPKAKYITEYRDPTHYTGSNSSVVVEYRTVIFSYYTTIFTALLLIAPYILPYGDKQSLISSRQL